MLSLSRSPAAAAAVAACVALFVVAVYLVRVNRRVRAAIDRFSSEMLGPGWTLSHDSVAENHGKLLLRVLTSRSDTTIGTMVEFLKSECIWGFVAHFAIDTDKTKQAERKPRTRTSARLAARRRTLQA